MRKSDTSPATDGVKARRIAGEFRALRPSHVSADPPSRILILLGVSLAVYLAFGKGFAYAGYPPLFVGELLLAIVILSVVRPDMALPHGIPSILLLGLWALGFAQLVDDLLAGSDPALETFRGFAVIYYSAFAFGLFALLSRHSTEAGRIETMNRVDHWLRRSTPFILSGALGVALLLVVNITGLPKWPGSGQPVFRAKSTDISVALAFLLPVVVGASSATRRFRHPRLLIGMWGLTAIFVSFRSRGALLALLISGLVTLTRIPARAVKLAFFTGVALILLYVTGLSVPVGGRTVSFHDATASVTSLLPGGHSDEQFSNYNGTREWRATWWKGIWSDVDKDVMIVNGKGWGDNLAIRYGIRKSQDAADPTVLRLPHNIFFSLAGRSGLIMALGFLTVIGGTVASTQSPRIGRDSDRISVRAARGGIVAAVVIAMTDVYLESPQGAIPLWCSCGFLWWVTNSRHRSPTGPSHKG